MWARQENYFCARTGLFAATGSPLWRSRSRPFSPRWQWPTRNAHCSSRTRHCSWTLEANFYRLRGDQKEATSPYRPATLGYLADDGERRSLSIQVKTRGDFRLDTENCKFKALMLRFSGPDSAGTPFAGQQDVPLVTHCRSGEAYEQYVLRVVPGLPIL